MTGQKPKGNRRSGVETSVIGPRLARYQSFLVAAVIAVGLCWIFWAPLWEGGSLIGGDLFPYFFPQKVFLAEQLRAGVIPLWNPLTGQGYPVIAESQTGVCYLPDLVAYRYLPVTMAYNSVQIVHYILAFLGTWLLAKRLGCDAGGALLAAVSFIYGWFPPRICLEWAIVTGAYLPWILWCAEAYLQSRRTRYLAGTCGLLTLQLLAGHFHVAFLTQLTLAVYAPLRVAIANGPLAVIRGPWSVVRRGKGGAENVSIQKNPQTSTDNGPQTSNAWPVVWAAIAVAFLLAAVQVVPTWELKQRSQRSDISSEHLPGYGHLPPQYWLQVIAPWYWYSGDIDQRLGNLPNYAGGAATNMVEAHLYFGSLPLMLAVAGFCISWRSRSEPWRLVRWWGLIGLAFLLYTPGWLLPVAQYLPGFSFFHGPGRYGIVTSLAVALMAGLTCSQLSRRLETRWSMLLTLAIVVVTAGELWWVAQQVGYSQFLSGPVVEQRANSPLRRMFAAEPQPARLFAPMANVANLLDVSALPVYLGIGPEQYFDPQFIMPAEPNKGLDPAGRPDQIAWLQQAGVTHILSLEKLPLKNWPADLIWTDYDPVFSRALGRPHEPLYLYRLHDSRGRIAWKDPPAADSQLEITDYRAHRVAARCSSDEGGQIVLTDLTYPGWQVEIDGQEAAAESNGMFRAVTVGPGTHEVVWSYRPRSVLWGAIISIVSLMLVTIGGLWFSRRSKVTSKLAVASN